nr:PREDICTED: cell adhesion molecule 3-like [Pelecanus crispus]
MAKKGVMEGATEKNGSRQAGGSKGSLRWALSRLTAQREKLHKRMVAQPWARDTLATSQVPSQAPVPVQLLTGTQGSQRSRRGLLSAHSLQELAPVAIAFPSLLAPLPLPFSCSHLDSSRLQQDRADDASPVPSTSSTYHAVIGGVVAVIVFLLLSLLIVLGHYLIRHKGTYLTHEAKGSDDAPDADTAIINAEGGQAGGDDKKEYFI